LQARGKRVVADREMATKRCATAAADGPAGSLGGLVDCPREGPYHQILPWAVLASSL
jgi:hypothetical protein